MDRAFVRAWVGSPQDYQALVRDYLEERQLPNGAQQFLEALVK